MTVGLPSGCWSSCGEELAESEVSAALTMGRAFAGIQIAFGLSLRERLPRVREALAAGELDVYRARLIDSETRNVDDEHLAAVESEVLARVRAAAAGGGVGLTGRRLANAVRRAVVQVDPAGVRARRVRAKRERFVGTSPCEDAMVTLIGKLTADDGRILEGRLREVANTVCPRDPRTFEQRKADALMVLISGNSQLPCVCGRVDCTQPAADAAPVARKALVHVLVRESTLCGEDEEPGYLDGYGVIDADHARDLAKGAVVKPVKVPATADPAGRAGESSEPATDPPGRSAADQKRTQSAATQPGRQAAGASPEPELESEPELDGDSEAASDADYGAAADAVPDSAPDTAAPPPDSALRYRPEATLDTWMRIVFGTCAWPHCDVPAWDCDLDHRIPFDHNNPAAGGPTTEANLTPYCRRHHRMKHTGHWRQHRRPDGDVDYTAPTGHTYRQPGGGAFNLLDIDPGGMNTGGNERGPVEDADGVGDTGPEDGHLRRRHRTRAQNRAARIHTERRLNRQRIDDATARREDHLRIMFGHSGKAAGEDNDEHHEDGEDEQCPY
ncbi:HNH endonuclease signature motif containing protein [Speluncibacter jeojiensis]|uniref:HNH endonuclease signature motif containing protein n=1 Tax=Speluncibacter jeojiensis TaxID=2710754 RepID=UPI00240EA798|nr:HNH endonuclease signature motif containing protein [Rhodococcus sp. D2-41]